ncbi:hypothetical protein RI129_009253 [Pyrocoelia pectoralis]|uniref:Uncharacterized protein n=1 Tax=Pyrocoelia pectoralis TaxID=417401 RepID=A0AAN7V863_9COLE
MEQSLLDTRKEWKRRHRKEHRRSISSDNVRPKSWERERYPESWCEIKERGYDQETLTDMKLEFLKRFDECLDYRKQFLFETPSLLLHPFVYKDVAGKERIIPVLSRRMTKTRPKISFSVTEKVEYSTTYNRKYVLDYVPKLFREHILKIIACSSHPSEPVSSKPATRRWFPKIVFSNVERETECRVLENSLGLSFLQNYSDEEEQDKDDTKPIETKSANKKKEISRRRKSKDDTRKRKKKNKGKKNKKCKGKKETSKKSKHAKTQKEKIHEEINWVERIEAKPQKADKCVVKDSKYKRNSEKEIERNKTKKAMQIDEKNAFCKTVEIQNEQSKKSQCVELTDKKTNKQTFIQQSYLQKPDKLDKKDQSSSKERKSKEEQHIDSVSKKKDMYVKNEQFSTNKCSAQLKKDQLLEGKSKKEVEDIEGDLKCTTGEGVNTPDTDEYYSNWESEDELLNSSTSKQSDLYTDTSGVNVSWESDTDIPLSKSPVREFYQSPHKEVSDFSPFRNRFINERRRSRCSLDNPSPPFLEMPLNIRNYRKIQWQEERHNTEHINFRLQNDQKSYSLYTEDSWEKDDYMTIKNEELRLEEERRTLMEERRQLEIEKKKLEELERERYYFHRSNDEKYSELYLNSDNRYHHKSYRYHREGEFEKTSRKSSLELAPESVDATVEVVRHIEKKPPAVSRKHRKSKWQDIDVNELEIKNVYSSKQEIKENSQCSKDMFSGKHSSPNKIEVQKPEVLETEYEKFMKALGSQTAKEKEPSEKKRKNVSKKRLKKSESSSSSSSSSSSCDSDSSSTSVTSSSSSSYKKRREERKKCVVLKKVTHSPIKKIKNVQVIKIEDVERGLFEKEGEVLAIQLPQLEVSEHKTVPLPVPSPKVDSAILNVTPSIPDTISVVPTITVSPINAEEKVECKELTPKKNNIIPIKFLTPELRKLAYDTTHANEIGAITISSPVQMKPEHQNYSQTDSPLMNISTIINDFNLDDKTLLKNEEEVTTSECTEVAGSISQNEVHTDKLDFKEVIQNNNLTITKTDTSSSLRRKDDDLLIRNEETKQSNDSPVKHTVSSKRKKERKDSENVSPISEINRKLSSNQFNHFAINKCTKTEKENLQRISSVEKCSNLSKASPLSSPLDGFKRSVADSTISDEQLLQSNLVECIESPNIYKNPAERSPRRMSLDERINQALGRSEEPKPITTTYSNNCNYEPQYFEECFDSYVDEPKKLPILIKQDQHSARENSKLKVLQVGNILQVVPTEDYSEISIPPKKKTPLQQNKISNSTQKILQVGNMLQIVPTTSFPDNFEMESENSTPPVPSTSTPVKNTFNAEILIKQKAERRAEKDKRKQERQLKRKEKEKKRKERERRKQLKVKLQTEAMIKQALILEDANVVDEQHLSEPQKPAQWPPIPQIVSNSAYRPPGKGILSQRKEEREELLDKRKQVQFSDGIKPGEGTSPSGGEDLSSPPPAARKLPKEKRFRKMKPPKKEKVPKKKKVKVKVIRQQAHYDDESEEDTLPPPPPPPGSPPPHLFPARIKEPIFNNIHSNILTSITNTPIQTPDTSYPPPVFRPSAPVVIPHHIPLHPPGPPPQVHRHHLPPPLPTSVLHHGVFNQSTNIIPHGTLRKINLHFKIQQCYRQSPVIV